MQDQPELAEQWRDRASEPPGIEGDRSEPLTPQDIRSFVPTIVGEQVHYRRRDAKAIGSRAAFVDKGRRIDIHDWRNEDSTFAALQLAAQKWDHLTVTGNDAYKTMCVKLAVEHGFRIANPELQKRLQKERQK